MTNPFLAIAAAAAFLAGAAAHAQTGAPAPRPDYTVFVDPPTGFVFVKLPQGWRFAGRIDEKEVTRLPPWVATTLLPGDPLEGVAASTTAPSTDAVRR
ncbi:MAG TPA: hypothetical protein PLX45_05350 [Piscinibacter sp.]|jgi:hypothetical protein|nr:hypothetical protein [Piscinibacter sp.]